MSDCDAPVLTAGQASCLSQDMAPSSPWRAELRRETRLSHVLVCIALWSVISYLAIQNFLCCSVVVSGLSMWPTLMPGDSYFVNRLTPRFASYHRGDLVVIRDEAQHELIVKRIVGLPSDHVQIKGGRVYVNGQALKEPYLPRRTWTTSPTGAREVVVPPGRYFVLGDNRPVSEDSRWFGTVAKSSLLGTLVGGS